MIVAKEEFDKLNSLESSFEFLDEFCWNEDRIKKTLIRYLKINNKLWI